MTQRPWNARRRIAAALAGLSVVMCLSGCGGRQTGAPDATAGLATTPGRFYPPPGPPRDPWGPYITEAATRFAVPAQWIRAVMRQESDGQQQAVSSAGAMGLMQLMPPTYGDLRDRYALGNDPFEPHDNIMAGAAYIKEMYDRYGAPAFLAAYNAGPQRLDDYLTTGTPLPAETIGYLTAIAPHLGTEVAMTGPLAVYAGSAEATGMAPIVLASSAPTPRSLAAGCDPDAAYDPDHPCRALERAAITPAPAPPVEPRAAPGQAPEPAPVLGGWAIQVGAFQNADLARAMAERARTEVPDLLAGAAIQVPTTAPFGGQVLYRARLVALSSTLATLSCRRLNARQLPCIVVRPGAAA
jgi:cell division septation protein DedD